MTLSLRYIVVFLFAIIPAIIWLYLFFKKHTVNKWLVLFTFIGGMIAAKIILIYQGYWDSTVNLIFFKVSLVDFRSNIEAIIANVTLALFVSFLGIGVMEEFLKFWIMKSINSNFFRSIDDVIELAIISALGFAFFENIIYFFNNWGNLSTMGFFTFALIRVTIVTMVHILSSGILGYYYGMAFFASPMLKIQKIKKKDHPIIRFISRIFRFKKSHIYHNEMFLIGLLLAMFVHAIYDFVLSINIKIAGLPLFIPIILLYFFGGYTFLNSLLKKKQLNLKLGLVGTRAMPERDFEELLAQMQNIKDEMRTSETDKPIS